MFLISKMFKACRNLSKYNVAWLLTVILLPFTSGDMYEGDACMMKSTPGVCKLASECTELETAVRSGRFSSGDIVNCGYTTQEEIICCPGQESVRTDNRSDDRLIFEQALTTTTSTTTTEASSAEKTTTLKPDFWLHLLSSTTSTTTAKPDFWLHLLNTTTSTTTPASIVINGKKLDTDSGFIDLSALLSQQKQSKKNNEIILKRERTNSDSDSYKNSNSPDEFTSGFQQPPQGIPNPTLDYNIPSPRPWSTGSMRNFEPNPNMPFRADSLDQRTGRRQPLWNAAEPNFVIQPDKNSFHGNAQISRPTEHRDIPQPRTFSNQINQIPNVMSWSEPNRGNKFNMLHPALWNNYMGPTSEFSPNDNSPLNDSTFKRAPISASDFLPNRLIFPNSNNARASNSFNNKARDPNAMINENLKKPGLDIISANTNFEQFVDNSAEEATTTARLPVSDIYAPFQFRPQPTDYEDNTINEKVSSENSNNFRFPGAAVNRQIWDINPSSKSPTGDEAESTTQKISTQNNSTKTPVTTRGNDRPAVIACREIVAGLSPGLTQHILGGTPVGMGEFPHMVAIGYSRIGSERGPYDYRCGGTLIAKQFVLTAAHCVNSRDSQPAVALLGLVDLDDEDQRKDAEEIPIRRVHIHPEYSSSRTYHDVAILELERDVNYSEFIYPSCLNTDLEDPPKSSPLYVTGWGQINTSNRQKSTRLLKAKLDVVSVSQCNSSYVQTGLNRRIADGVTNSQLCAHDPGFTKDACQGDSGGPLNLVVDESLNQYRIVGIISAGFSCGSATPGLYARVASYLDFIESVVWPNL